MNTIEVVGPRSLDIDEYIRAANKAFPSSTRSVDMLRWKWSDNGYGEPLFVLARNPRRALVGALSFGTFGIAVSHQPLSAWLSYDTFVVPEARGSGVFAAMLRQTAGALVGRQVAFNFPNSSASSGFANSGWARTQHARQYSTVVPPLPQPKVERPDDAPVSGLIGRDVWLHEPNRVEWEPSAPHLAWRLARPSGAPRLLRVDDIFVLASTSVRRRFRELRILEVWSDQNAAFTTAAVRSVARKLRCQVATWPLSSGGPRIHHQLALHGWISRRSRATLHIWNQSDAEATCHQWRLSGLMFHTW